MGCVPTRRRSSSRCGRPVAAAAAGTRRCRLRRPSAPRSSSWSICSLGSTSTGRTSAAQPRACLPHERRTRYVVRHALTQTDTPHNVACALVLEMYLAAARAAAASLADEPHAHTAQWWRNVGAGLVRAPEGWLTQLPPLAAHLCAAPQQPTDDALHLADVLDAFLGLPGLPLDEWAALDARALPAARPWRDELRDALTAWRTGAPPLQADEVLDHAVTQAYTATWTAGAAPGALVAVGCGDARLHVALALAVLRAAQAAPDVRGAAALCAALDGPVLDVLFLYVRRAALFESLSAAISAAAPWQHGAEAVGDVVLALARLAAYGPLNVSVGDSRAFGSLNVPVLPRAALCADACALVDRWCDALLHGGDADVLLNASPPWTLYRVAPTLMAHSIEAHRAGTLERPALSAVVRRFLEPALRYTMPCVSLYLVEQAHHTLAAAQYASALMPDVALYVDVVYELLTAAACPPAARAVAAPAALSLLMCERIALLRPQLDLRVLREALAPSLPARGWLALLLQRSGVSPSSPSSLARDIAAWRGGAPTPATAARLCEAATQGDVTRERLLAAAFAQADERGPLALALRAVRGWDGARIGAPALARVLMLSVALAQHLPGGPPAVAELQGALALRGADDLLHV